MGRLKCSDIRISYLAGMKIANRECGTPSAGSFHDAHRSVLDYDIQKSLETSIAICPPKINCYIHMVNIAVKKSIEKHNGITSAVPLNHKQYRKAPP
ncbi:TPA: hypothetical protein MYR80_005298 [Citrobacter freundii]|uniref:hypothetical protein n=1 Tax=Citrobacter freundii TaxID=546 RepID=UPI001A307367|nr:hypothetical protein [Citrobacter freundii]HCB2475495.1 hypothetical protein [Citrobacter freundii]HDQ2972042.1 hypothetical protein [Citrobacter freundii]HDW0182333.1 hypothetical protein [Enterobacter asburiae]HEG1965367.1 hypothetical protein [Citrobacter freundii]